jgi:predicted DsbA family dithiol-disulfide isomerase
MRIDFVSDVVCPWCVIGLKELETALGRLGDLVAPEIHFQPFELNPAMPHDGENMDQHIAHKYGRSAEETATIRGRIKDRAAHVGFAIKTGPESRIYNSFDAHRLLHWAGLETDPARNLQAELKHALFQAYFTEGRNIADHAVLLAKAESVGLDPVEARAVLESGRYAEEVRAAEQEWQGAGINSVPAIVIDKAYLISGGQPAAVFEESLRQIAAKG